MVLSVHPDFSKFVYSYWELGISRLEYKKLCLVMLRTITCKTHNGPIVPWSIAILMNFHWFFAPFLQILAEHKGLLDICGRVLNLRLIVDSSKDKRERWWSVLETLREHTLVCMSNIAGHIKLIDVAHQVSEFFGAVRVCHILCCHSVFWFLVFHPTKPKFKLILCCNLLRIIRPIWKI